MRTALFIIALAITSSASENPAIAITEIIKTIPISFFIFGLFIGMDLADFFLNTKK